LKQALYCIRCSACYNVCPVYQNIGGHAYGWVYQGPIGAVITPQLLGLKNAPDLPFASSLCGSCTDVCPVKIPLHHLLLYQRNRVVKTVHRPATEKAAIAGFVFAAGSASRFGKIGWWGAWLQRMLDGLLRVPGWSNSRELPTLAKKSFRRWWKENVAKQGGMR
ncbi:MAG: 4Fe-4S dicluster domain-containing protein, partial [Calditrichia bacterium]